MRAELLSHFILQGRSDTVSERLNRRTTCYRARNVLSYTSCTRHIMQNYLAFRDSPIIPFRRSPCRRERWNDGKLAFALSFLLLLPLAQKQQPDATIRLATWKANTNGRRGEKQPVQVCREFESKKRILNVLPRALSNPQNQES